MILSLMILSCSTIKSIDDKKHGTADIREIYKMIIKRDEEYNKCKIFVNDELIVKPIDDSNFDSIRRGLKQYNKEIQSAIDDYNDINDSADSFDTLRALNNIDKKEKRYKLSKIGFNDSHEYAVLYEYDNYSPELGHGSFIFLRKIGDKWSIETEIMDFYTPKY
jgi:hypothetical protein